MGAEHVDLADAVKTFLNGESYSQEFTATRRYTPITSAQDLADLTVTVYPGTRRSVVLTRGTRQKFHTVHVAVQQKLAHTSEANAKTEADALVLLMEEIGDSLEGQTQDSKHFRTINENQHSPLFNSEALREAGVFSSVITLEYSE